MKTSTKFEILHEDDDILVINKPAGVVVNDAKTVRGETVQSWMRQRLENETKKVISPGKNQRTSWQNLVPDDFDDSYGTPQEIFEKRAGMVHRLDKDTSGALILAKNPGSLVNLLSQFKKRTVKKKYQCLVHGLLKVKTATLNYPIARSPRDGKRFTVIPDGRSAQTEYQVLETFSRLNQAKANFPAPITKKMGQIYQGFTLIECFPKTGRTHQIRVHLAHIKHPLVGDSLYVGKKRQKLDLTWCQRQFLHASELEVTHPKNREELIIIAPLATDLQNSLSLLEK